MVNRGASRGCITCRLRRVKCDEHKPVCLECDRVGRKCQGYGKKPVALKFRDETARFSSTSPARQVKADDNEHEARIVTTPAREGPIILIQEDAKSLDRSNVPNKIWRTRSPATPGTLKCLQPHQQDFAVAFFLTYVTSVGRSLESTRGFLEFVQPVLATERQSSALVTSVNAVATKLWATMRPGGLPSALPAQLLDQALVQLQRATFDPKERGRDGTVLAALVLQFHDTLSAVTDQHKARGTHRAGALALLQQRNNNSQASKYHGHLLANLFHSKISYCTRQRAPLTEGELEWFENQVIPNLPLTPSSMLDMIGISVSKLQGALGKFCVAEQNGLEPDSSSLTALTGVVDAQLAAWTETIPDLWHPRRLHSGEDFDVSVDAYHGACDIYPSIQITNIWNQWRIYRLIVAQAKLAASSADRRAGILAGSYETESLHLCEAQDQIDSICYSVPFYLGNCRGPPSFSDVDAPIVILPSYHNLRPTDKAFVRYQASDHYASRIDHARHVILQGPLNIMSALSNLIGMLSDEQRMTIGQPLQQEQREWIQGQFMRSLSVMRFGTKPYPMEENPFTDEPLSSLVNRHDLSEAEVMARTIKQTWWTMNIL